MVVVAEPEPLLRIDSQLGTERIEVVADQRRIILLLCSEFLLLNILLTGVSLWWGAALYGYGFALSVLVTLATALALLDRRLGRLEYETFMLQ